MWAPLFPVTNRDFSLTQGRGFIAINADDKYYEPEVFSVTKDARMR